MKKTISVIIPTYNEEENIGPLTDALCKEFAKSLSQYDYEIVIIDNDSQDKTREIIRNLCNENKNIKAIFNEKNVGWLKSPVYGMMQTTGDCTVMLCADFQDPIELIPEFVAKWELGAKVVVGQKTSAEESILMYSIRSIYYKLIQRFSDNNYIEHFTGFGLYDKSFVDLLRNLDDSNPFLRGYVSEFVGHPEIITYNQPKRKHGKSWGSFSRLYDTAMVSITAYTKVGLRFATFLGIFSAILSFGVGFFYLVYKLTHWYSFTPGMAPLVVGIFFVSGVQLFFLGMIGEYILSMNERIKNRPLVVEKERINFDDSKKNNE